MAASVAGAAAASPPDEPLAVMYQLPAAFEVVVGDLGMSQLASLAVRNVLKLRTSDKSLGICTLQYRSPDLCLGDQRYGTEVDMWSFGCVAAELVLREPLVPGTEDNRFTSRYPTRPSFVRSLYIDRSVARSLGR